MPSVLHALKLHIHAMQVAAVGAFLTDRADVGGFLSCRIILHPCCVSHPGPPAGLSKPPVVSLLRAYNVARNHAVVWQVCTSHQHSPTSCSCYC